MCEIKIDIFNVLPTSAKRYSILNYSKESGIIYMLFTSVIRAKTYYHYVRMVELCLL